MTNKNPQVDNYIAQGCGRCPLGGTPDCKVHTWTRELEKLRALVLNCGLTEELKWGVACYTYQNKNVLIVSAFKEFCAISFFKGVLLDDPHHILEKPGEHSQAARIVKFTSIEKIEHMQTILHEYIQNAIQVEKDGRQVEFKKHPEPIPKELQRKLDDDPFFKTAFDSLTPGRQRGYIIFISQAKQPATRMSRIEKCVPKILNGEGLYEKYKSGPMSN